ncbi:hypothetical protein [Psychrobacter sp. 16-MNA-CIBAN-0192]|uniref:McrC family protein n=1 Tax=Psychrobacter sp. 16-MNA-CIBAN-0192 TaxID=3140448 RepID=UPI00331F3362
MINAERQKKQRVRVNHGAFVAHNDSIMSVFEHQRLTVQDFVHASDFMWLMAQEFAVFSIQRQRGQWQLKVGHYIGIIVLPSDMTLEILPKPVAGMARNNALQNDEIASTRQWVQRMLSTLFNPENAWQAQPHTQHMGQFSPHLSALTSQTLPLSTWLITQFLQKLTRYYPNKNYQLEIDTQARLQGKLLIKEQLRRHGAQPHKFVSEVSILSQDLLHNRLIKSAFMLLAPLFQIQLLHIQLIMPQWQVWQPITPLTVHELHQLQPIYISAKRQLNSQPLSSSQRQTAQQLLDIAYWLLQAQQPNIKAGSSISTHSHTLPTHAPLRLCLLINMNQAFEQWVSQCLSDFFVSQDESKTPRYELRYQPRDVWLRDHSGQACLSIQPDMLVYRVDNIQQNENSDIGNKEVNPFQQCSHVIDTKWKHLAHPRDISASDAYQLTSYAQAYQAEQVWLVYPTTDYKRAPVLLTPTNNTDRRQAKLWLMPFNLMTGTLNQQN